MILYCIVLLYLGDKLKTRFHSLFVYLEGGGGCGRVSRFYSQDRMFAVPTCVVVPLVVGSLGGVACKLLAQRLQHPEIIM